MATHSSILACGISWTEESGSVQSLSCVGLLATPWTAAHQASLSITNSQSLIKLMSIELVMTSNHLILCHQHLSAASLATLSQFISHCQPLD